MTKSVKEKYRLTKIRECKLNGIPVPAELLKVKIIRNILKINKKQKLTRDYNFHARKFQEHFKKHINNLVVNIANQMEIYDLKVMCIPRYHSPFIYLYLFDEKGGKNLGRLSMLQEEQKAENNNFEPEDFYSYVFDGYKIIKDERTQTSMKISPGKVKLFEDDFSKKFSKYKNKIFYKNISMFISKINIFKKETKISKSSLFFNVSGDISCRFSMNGKVHQINNINNASELDILKAFIELGCIEINIPEEDLIMEKIEEIKNIIRLSNY